MRVAKTAFFVSVAAVLGLLVSCGGGSSSPESPPPAQAPPAQAETGAAAADPSDRGARTLAIPPAGEGQATALPPGHPPLEGALPTQAPSIVPPPPGSGTGAQSLAWAVPSAWTAEKPASMLRKAQYRVPGPGGDGECVVFYFGPGQGGDAMSNAVRWAQQFKQPDGRASEQVLKTSNLEVGEMKVLQAEVTGTYLGGQTMTMQPMEEKPGYMLLGAVAEGPDANWFFKLTGPEATVRSQRSAFEEMIKSLKSGN